MTSNSPATQVSAVRRDEALHSIRQSPNAEITNKMLDTVRAAVRREERRQARHTKSLLLIDAAKADPLLLQAVKEYFKERKKVAFKMQDAEMQGVILMRLMALGVPDEMAQQETQRMYWYNIPPHLPQNKAHR